jgi:PAS domain S-box-containing protein
MWALLERLLNSSMYSPHGICLLWEPELIWLHVGSDALTAIAYFSIPFALATFVSKRKDVQFGFIAWAFFAFILACGLTHLLAIYTLWVPIYGVEGLVKALTAGASIVTAIMLWYSLPKLLAIPNSIQLRQGEERFRLVVESAPAAMAMVDQRGTIVLVNRRTEKLFGYGRDELLGMPVERLMPERYRQRHPGHRDGVFATPAPTVPDERRMAAGRELHALRKDGSEFAVEIGLNSIQTDAGIMVLSAMVDVTERKQAEQQSLKFSEMLEQQVVQRTGELVAANKELDDFAHVASHDLKAPLRVIDNASKWLEEDLAAHLDDETRDTMRLLRGRVKRMEKLLDDLLQYSRVGRTSEAASDGMVAGDELVDDILALLLPPKGFKVTVGPGFAAIRLERMPLQQILMNLIGNAIKHHDRKEGRIELEVEDRGGLFAFAVKDDGPGIPSQFHDEIFKIFRTLKPRDQVEGSGMGLAIVRKHIDISGGTLRLESAEGKGSTFHFTWPKPQEKFESRVRKSLQ